VNYTKHNYRKKRHTEFLNLFLIKVIVEYIL